MKWRRSLTTSETWQSKRSNRIEISKRCSRELFPSKGTYCYWLIRVIEWSFRNKYSSFLNESDINGFFYKRSKIFSNLESKRLFDLFSDLFLFHENSGVFVLSFFAQNPDFSWTGQHILWLSPQDNRPEIIKCPIVQNHKHKISETDILCFKSHIHFCNDALTKLKLTLYFH